MRSFLVAVLLVSTAACAPHSAPLQVVTLDSGKQVKLLGVGNIAFSNDAPALMLKYETDLSLDDKAKLTQEADELWKTFRVDVERAQLATGIISANDHPTGFVVATNKSFNFVYKRRPDGEWSRIGS